MLIVLVTSVVALGLTTVIFYVEDMLSFRGHEMENRRALAEIVCRDTRNAIRDNNRAHALETLQALAGDPHILSAWIVLSSGEVFASYVRQPGEGVLPTVEKSGRLMLAPGALADDAGLLSGLFASIKTVYTCTYEGNAGCTTVIISDTQDLKSRMSGYLVLVLLVLLGVAVLGYLVTFRLQRIITDPLASLVNTMERIRTTRDYSHRVESGRTDEIGILAECFNQMLDEVKIHGEQVRLYQDRLADLLAVRTEELLRVKEETESRAGRDLVAALPYLAGKESCPGRDDEHLRLYALIDCIDGEVWFLDAGSGIVTANRAAAETLVADFSPGLDREALAEGFEIYHFDLQRLKEENKLSVLNVAGMSVRRMEVALLSDGEDQRFQLLNAEPYRNRAGELAGTVFLATDITVQKKAAASLRAISSRLIEGEESLRKSLAAELHDEIGRDIAALHLFHETITSGMSVESREQLDDKIGLVNGLLDGLSCKVAGIIGELRPPMLDDFGLSTALKSLAEDVCKRHEIEVDLLVDDHIPRWGGAVETALYRIAQEAVNNAVKHSGAGSITVSLEEDDGMILLTVSDNGCGFDPAMGHGTVKRPSWGLSIMRERAEAIGASLSLKSAPGAGTSITVQLERALCQ